MKRYSFVDSATAQFSLIYLGYKKADKMDKPEGRNSKMPSVLKYQIIVYYLRQSKFV